LTSKELVLDAMKGKATRIPIYYWLADPALEAKVGDIVGVRCWFRSLNFLEEGGPFKRGQETRREWCDRLDPGNYDWPSVDALEAEMDEIVAETIQVDSTKSFQLEILGPTEYSEYSCSPGRTSEARRLDQVSHQFDFSILTILDRQKADLIHRRFHDVLLAVTRQATKYEEIDSIRIADDFCSYTGSVYRPDFTERILERQINLGQAIMEGGKYSILHSDGDISTYLTRLSRVYSGFHPLDLQSKSTLTDAREWARRLVEPRRLVPESVFFTGIPVDLLCNPDVSAQELVGVAESVIHAVGRNRLILTTTHRPYPGCLFRDFQNKVCAIGKFLNSQTTVGS